MAKSKAPGLKEIFPAGFDPKPTVFNGGIDRMIKLWEAHRDVNEGGYGSGVVCHIDEWGKASKVTSCSPFTATVIGAMFDPEGGEDATKTYKPLFDGGTTPLPQVFYAMHQGNLFHRKGAAEWWAKNKWPRTANCSTGSIVHFGLGYEIDPRDMRRGDMVGIDWSNKGGHATFCWDVHLNAAGEVDCFLFLSSNGGKSTGGGYHGYGVSVGTFNPENWITSTKKKAPFKKAKTVFQDDPDYIQYGKWYCLPHVDAKDVDLKTFKDPTPKKTHIIDSKSKGTYIASLRVIRFYGFAPPENPHGTRLKPGEADLANQHKKWNPPESYASGSGTPSTGMVIEGTKPTKTPKSNPDPVAANPPKPADQKKKETVSHQLWTELSLQELFLAGWLDADPGKPDNVADAQSKKTLKEFQQKWKLDTHGHADKATRQALEKALSDLHEGKPNPHETKPPKPELKHAYWLKNNVEPGGSVSLAVDGGHLDLVKSYDVTLTDKKTGASEKVTARITIDHGHGVESITIPEKFAAGAQLTAKVHGTSNGGDVDKSIEAILYVKGPKTNDWVWEEEKWPSDMKDTLKQLRLTHKGSGQLEQRKITQYGVWDRMRAGETAVLDTKSKPIGFVDKKSLYLADLAATMRLDGRILNLWASGNVFDPKTGMASFDKFDPKKSKWVDVTEKAPWGMGAKMPLIPYRTLAFNAAKEEKKLYGKRVFIQELVGVELPTGETHNGVCIIGDAGSLEPGKQFDLFVGPDGNRLAIPEICNVEIYG